MLIVSGAFLDILALAQSTAVQNTLSALLLSSSDHAMDSNPLLYLYVGAT